MMNGYNPKENPYCREHPMSVARVLDIIRQEGRIYNDAVKVSLSASLLIRAGLLVRAQA
jgi:hypothetical protein